jgi:hypothetical protein
MTALEAGLALALLGAGAPEIHAPEPCAAEAVTFCSDVKPGAGRIVRCLEEHESKLSDACRARLDADQERAKKYIGEFLDACHSDTERLCVGVQPGGGRLVKCLSTHDYELSPRCVAELDKLKAARERVDDLKQACQADAARLCPDLLGHAGEVFSCLKAKQAALSPACRSAEPGLALEAAILVDTVDEMTSRARLEDTLEILQGLNSVAFSRNQITFSYDYLQGVAALPANLNSLTFNPLFVFGPGKQFAVQIKVPVAAIFPTQAGHPTVSGVADVNTAFGWAFWIRRSFRQYLAIGLQWNSASESLVGAPWVIAPVYAFSLGLTPWLSLTTELAWNKSFGHLGNYPGVNFLVLRPILACNLPSQVFIAVDTRLGYDFIKEIFVPVMRFQGGKLIGRERNVSIAAYYQLSLNTVGKQDSFDFGVGASLSYFFDW